MNLVKRLNASLLVIILALVLGSWGYLVHKTTHQLAVYELPSGMQKFYYRNIKYLVDSAPRPDMRRNYDTTEGQKHFIDLEMFGDSSVAQLPLTWAEAINKFSKDSLLAFGYVPYQVLATKENLTRAFTSRNADSILFYSVDLGHYIADANVPLHTSVNYDGQFSGQKGLHSLWESMVPEIALTNYDLRSKHKAKYLDNPAREVMAAIQRATDLLPDVFGKEKEVSAAFTDAQKYQIQLRWGKQRKTYSPEFVKAYAAALGSTINDQLVHSADLIADFWYTSWVDAGRPDLDGLLQPSPSKKDRKALKKELKSFRHNRLVQDSVLRSIQSGGTD